MKAWMLAIMLLPVSAQADIELKTSRISYGLGSYGDFTFKAYQVGYTKIYKGYGLTLLGGQSEEDQGHYMRRFFTLALSKHIDLGQGFTVIAGANYSEYLACSRDWGCNPDTGEGWTLGIQKRITKEMSIKLSIDDYYTKQHKSLGIERTKGVGVTLVFK